MHSGAPRVHKKGLEGSWAADGDGRSREEGPRRGQYLDVVVMVDVLAETGRGDVVTSCPTELEQVHGFALAMGTAAVPVSPGPA